MEASACSRFNFSNAKFAFIGKMRSVRNNLDNASIDGGNLSLCISSYTCDLKKTQRRGKQSFPVVTACQLLESIWDLRIQAARTTVLGHNWRLQKN